jgi:tetratricopeptide (TPR) repeat protein
MRSTPRRRALTFSLATTSAAFTLAIGTVVYRDAQADGLLGEARARLFAPFDEAPGIDRLQASTAASLIERARDWGASGDEVEGLYHYAQAIEDLQRGDLLLAEGELGSALERLGETPDLRVLAAALSRARMRDEEAQREVEAALDVDPEHPRALLLAADLALDHEDAAQALSLLSRLDAVAPDSGPVHNRIGLAHELSGDLDAAEDELRSATELDQRSHDAWINLGRLLRVRGDHEAAREAFETAVERSPSDPDAILGRGLTRAATGELALAVEDFRRAAELAPNDAEPLLALGDLERDLGEHAEAVETYREAIEREDADAASWLKLGNGLVLLEDYAGAADAFGEALERSPELAAAHNGLGAALMHTGQTERARAELERAFELDPTDPNPLMNLGLLYEGTGELASARTAWERVLIVWPGSPIATRRLARLGGRT